MSHTGIGESARRLASHARLGIACDLDVLPRWAALDVVKRAVRETAERVRPVYLFEEGEAVEWIMMGVRR